MYVVKVGEFYVKSIEFVGDFIVEVALSKEIMRSFNQSWAVTVASRINGEVIEINEEVANE